MATLIIVVTVAFAIAVLLGGVWFATTSASRVRRFARSTDLIPGRAGRAPAEWTRSNEPAAVEHRRIRYAIATVHENPWLTSTPDLAAALGRLDDEVFALDDRLIDAARAAQSDDVGPDAFGDIGFAVDELEKLPGRLMYVTPALAQAAIDSTIAFLRDPVEPAHTGGADDDLD